MMKHSFCLSEIVLSTIKIPFFFFFFFFFFHCRMLYFNYSFLFTSIHCYNFQLSCKVSECLVIEKNEKKKKERKTLLFWKLCKIFKIIPAVCTYAHTSSGVSDVMVISVENRIYESSLHSLHFWEIKPSLLCHE